MSRQMHSVAKDDILDKDQSELYSRYHFERCVVPFLETILRGQRLRPPTAELLIRLIQEATDPNA